MGAVNAKQSLIEPPIPRIAKSRSAIRRATDEPGILIVAQSLRKRVAELPVDSIRETLGQEGLERMIARAAVVASSVSWANCGFTTMKFSGSPALRSLPSS